MDYQSIVTFVMEMAGSVAFAASGAMVGDERNMDIFGVSVLGVATSVGGVNTGIRQGYMDNVFLLVFLGTITGVGGGLLRDMMASVPPYIFVKHIYACASIIGAVVCVYMNRFVGNVQAMVVSSIVVVLIRYLAAHYRWNLPRLSPHE